MKLKYLIATGIAVIASAGAYFAFKTNRVGNQVVMTSKSKVHGTYGSQKVLNLITVPEGIEVRTEVTLKNPTNTPLQIKQPFLKLLSNGVLLFASTPAATMTTVAANAETKLPYISLKMTFGKIIPMLQQVNYKGIAAANLTIVERINIIITNMADIQTSLGLEVEASTTVNGFSYTTKEKL